MTVPMRYPAPSTVRWAFMHYADVPSKVDPEAVYLRRLMIFKTPYACLFVHRIYEVDSDRDPHDHPWSFWSFVLRGGYTEQIWTDPLRHRDQWFHQHHPARSLHRMPVTKAHKITDISPGTVTLVLTGRKVRTWGFWGLSTITGSGWYIPWQDYVGEVDVPA